MKGEIDKDFYCALGRDKKKQRDLCNNECAFCDCEAYQRKWLTLEQFKLEYETDYPDDWAVYVLTFGGKWEVYRYDTFKDEDMLIVCACTPWGKPPADWRPEEGV